MGNKISQTNNYCTLLIQLNQNKIKYSIRTLDNKEWVKQEYSPISIAFDMNEIIIEKESEKSIYFMNDWIQQSEEFKEYQINYQNKEYKVIVEVLFALYANKYKRKIDKQFIIEETIVQFESHQENKLLLNRIKVSLDAIGLKLKEFEFPNYDYQSQGKILHEILDKYSEYNKYKSLFEKSNKTYLFNITQPLNEELFNEIIQRKLTTKERINLTQLDNYCLFISSKYFKSINDHINLVQTCRRLKLNMEKFYFNPLSLTQQTREYFPNLQTLFIYYSNDNHFETDKRIIKREPIIKKYNLCIDQVIQLEKWTQLKCGEIVFDSEKDNWNKTSSIFNERIIGKEKLMFIIQEDEKDEIFGCFINTEIIDHFYAWISTDLKSFLFNIQSNGRLPSMMKFDIINTKYGYLLTKPTDDLLINIGNIRLYKHDTLIESSSWQNESNFNYYGIENALCGKKQNEYGKIFFYPKRIIIIQMNCL